MWSDRWAHRFATLAFGVLAFVVLSAHVGSNQVVFEGRAGGYPVRVMIDPPGVVPSQVPILVRVLEGTPTRVTVRAAQWNVGTKGAPPAEDAALVRGESGLWSHSLWIMTASTYSVLVSTEGPAGAGTLVVPMQTSATKTLGMNGSMGALLLGLGAVLVVGLLTLVGAAAREGTLPVGAQPSAHEKRTARLAMSLAAGLVTLALLGGSKWWNAEEAAYRRRLYRPLAIASSVRAVDSDRLLTIAIRDSLWRSSRTSPLIPDHGKLMHLFLIRVDGENVLAHLHPLRVHPDSFVTRLPPMPDGRYLLYGDLLFQSGTQRTLVDTIQVPVAPVVPESEQTIPAPSTNRFADVDDAWANVTAVRLGDSVNLATGGSLRLTADSPLDVGRDLRLVVSMRDADGTPSQTQPYMGMGGHAMVLRRDASLFMHLHPMGTASMTSQAQLIRRESGDTARLDSAGISALMKSDSVAGMSHAAHDPSTTLSFPFVFPTAGAFRVFVQVKRRGVVETAAFDVEVADKQRVP